MTLPLESVLSHIQANEQAAVERLKGLLRIPSVGTDPGYSAQTRQAARWLADELSSIGFEAGLRETGGQPAVVAHWPGTVKGAPHLLYYGHYDVQPPEPLELWTSPPFEPTVVDGPYGPQIVARGAVDDKGQVMTFIEAFRAWRDIHGGPPPRITVFLEGEEESGSPSLDAFLASHRDELAADVCIISDTTMWNIDTPAVVGMLRGLVYVELVIDGPNRDLHSGLYGGAVPNPLNVLCRILGRLHDDNGRVTLQGFYDRVPDDLGQQWRDLDFDATRFLGSIGLEHSVGEAERSVLERIWSRPTCDVNGLSGGYQGPGAKTVIPARASAKLSFRLVPDQDPLAVRESFRAHVEAHLPKGCRYEIIDLGAAPALRVPTESPFLDAAKTALAQVFARAPVLVGGGGSIPAVEAIKRHLGVDAVLMGFGLHDDRVHSPNEKFELRCFANGMRAHAALLAAVAAP